MITIVSLAWNEYATTEFFLKRLKRFTDIPHKLIFTDNASEQPIQDLVLKYYPDAKLIRNNKNVGCPGTRNKSMKYVDTDICFWLDNDCIVGPKWYEPILKKLEDPTIGISGPLGYTVKNPWQQPFPFETVEQGDCDWFMGYLVGFKTAAYKEINDYNIPVNLDDVELAWGVKSKGLRAVVSGPCFAQHITSKTKRGWTFNDQEKLTQLWSNWPNKLLFENFK